MEGQRSLTQCTENIKGRGGERKEKKELEVTDYGSDPPLASHDRGLRTPSVPSFSQGCTLLPTVC